MSKYKKALEAFTHIGLCDACGSQNLEKLCEDIIEALEIADRLEQIIKNGTNRITEVLCKDCREKELLEALGGCQGICRAMSNVIGGYELALTDIRGNTE